MMTTTVQPLSYLSTTGALDSYRLACLTDSPVHFKAAAHALAKALGRAPHAHQKAVETTTAPVKRAPRKVRAEQPLDLAAPLGAIPRAKQAVSAFVCAWEDGSETVVSAVVYHAGKPDSRWSAAFQAANRLRRQRARHAYAAELGACLTGRFERHPVGNVDWESAA